MKKTLIYTILLCLGICISCEDALDPKVYSNLTGENYPKTESDLNSLLIPLYAPFNQSWGTTLTQGEVDEIGNSIGGIKNTYASLAGWLHFSTTTTDEKVTNEPYEGENLVEWGPRFLENFVQSNYIRVKCVSLCTNFLAAVEKVDFPEDRQDAKKQLIAQARCLRAWHMFLLYDFYGPVSVIRDPALLSTNQYFPRPSKEEYISWMIEDLDAAIPVLLEYTNKANNADADWGRVNKGLALMLKMKIYMNDKQWAEADKVVDELLTMTGYGLMDNYKDVFSYSNIGNKEVVWGCPLTADTRSEDWFKTNFPADAKTVLGISGVSGWGVHFMPWDFYDTYTQGVDKRLETIAGTYENTKGEIKKANLGAVAVKYFGSPMPNAGLISVVAFRWADVLLSKAEILTQKNGSLSQTEFNQYVAPITDRAGTTSSLNISDVLSSKEKTLEFLLAERGRELYWEGWRRQDLIRYGKFIEKAVERGSSQSSEHRNLFPIPYSIILQSNGVYQQNPGY